MRLVDKFHKKIYRENKRELSNVTSDKALKSFNPTIIIRNVSTKRLYKSNMRRYCSIRVRLIRLFMSVKGIDRRPELSIRSSL